MRVRRRAAALITGGLLAAAMLALRAEPQQAGPQLDPMLTAGLRWRSIGPPRGGRSIAASGVKGRPSEAYFGAVGGGLWKTIDAGEIWTPVTDGQIKSSSVGALAVSESQSRHGLHRHG